MESISVHEICPSTTRAWIAGGAILVDVRESGEVEQLAFDVPECLHIPLTEFEERFNEIPQNRQVVMVCRSGSRSLRAAAYLLCHGYDSEKVVNMKHGILRWAQKGFPVKGDIASVVAKEHAASCCGSGDAAETCHTEDAHSGGCC